jgi:hypothetical protein
MSDFDLSATILSGMSSNSVTFPTTTSESQAGTDVKSGFSGGFDSYYFDINNPSDMMPLVFESGVELSPLFCGEWVASEVKQYTFEEEPIYGRQAVSDNPLRAAAIVYLLMQGGINER